MDSKKIFLLFVFFLVFFGTAHAINLQVFDLNMDANVYVGNPVTISTNIFSDENSSSFLVGFYQGFERPENLIYDYNVQGIDANSTKTISFQYTFNIVGANSIIVSLDRNGNVTETNEGDNKLIKNFVVQPRSGAPNFSAFTHLLVLTNSSKNCLIRFSNADLLIWKGAITDENTGISSAAVTITTYFGDILLDVNQAFSNSEFRTSEFTLRFLDVSISTTTLLIITPTAIGLEKDFCQTNPEAMMDKIKSLQNEIDKMQNDYQSAIANKQTSDALASDRLLQVQTLQSANTNCETTKSTCETANIALGTDYTKKLDDLKITYENSLAADRNVATVQVSSANNERDAWIINAMAMAVALMAMLIVLAWTWHTKGIFRKKRLGVN